MDSKMDRRRYGVIEVEFVSPNCYHLNINRQLWAEVEWSPQRRAWCIQDAAGHCLNHVEHIVEQDVDVQTAIRIAKKMIVNGSMPTPEEAYAQLEREQERKQLGEPFVIDPLPERTP
jgi:hypothetical protein